jgi:hypothetical protein
VYHLGGRRALESGLFWLFSSRTVALRVASWRITNPPSHFSSSCHSCSLSSPEIRIRGPMLRGSGSASRPRKLYVQSASLCSQCRPPARNICQKVSRERQLLRSVADLFALLAWIGKFRTLVDGKWECVCMRHSAPFAAAPRASRPVQITRETPTS